ncbi:type IV toxin-antitoxin system AbiEi family antitoxin domain-containing protein [Nocardia sp. NPDC052566]|uniref:type IV toxin-antitoxin system AbiEi family antitoxin domain-containing protein n=1 Tax=Nocardia sp. NPDC052566 TaxID=3364330 RepID=UPI0037C66C47
MDGDGVVRRAEALAAGFSDAELQRFVARGTFERIRPGAYCRAGVLADLGVEGRHALGVRATAAVVGKGCAASYESAAVLLGLELWRADFRRSHFTVSRSGGGRRTARLHLHAAAFDPDEVVEVDGIPVLGPTRTVIDLARSLPFEEAVVVGDAAVRKYDLRHEDLHSALARRPHRPGAAQARRVIDFLDGRSESVGESRSRVRMSRHHLPTPVPQYTVLDAQGKFVARVDFYLPDHGVIGEFDGAAKYGRLLKPGQTPGNVVYQEKLREDRLRDLGYEIVRWTWSDLDTFHHVATRFHRAMARAHR